MIRSLSTPDLRLLRVFIAVTEAGGFSAAQIELNVSQSTVSTQMADLETRLGVKLCRRGRVGFSLTEEGQAVYKSAKDLMRNCEAFIFEMHEVYGDISGKLRLGFADALVTNPEFPIDEVIRNIRQRMPNVFLILSEANPLELERQVLSQELDAAIHSFPNHAPGIRYIPLITEVQTLYCSPRHPLFERDDETISTDELEQLEYAGRAYYGGVLNTGALQPKSIGAQSSSMDGVVAFILSGQFLGHLPSQCAKRWVESGEMRPIHPQTLSYSATFEYALLKGVRLARRTQILEEVIVSAFPQSPNTH